MRVRAIYFLACLMLLATQIGAQPTRAPLPELRLELSLTSVADGLPTGFTFVLTNVSNGDLRIPPPEFDCKEPSLQGSLRLQESFVAVSGDTLGKGAGSCGPGGSVYPKPRLTLRELIQTWIFLRPGESVRIPAHISMMASVSPLRGMYTFSAQYFPPQLSLEVERLLSGSGIVFPRQSAATADQHYAKP